MSMPQNYYYIHITTCVFIFVITNTEKHGLPSCLHAVGLRYSRTPMEGEVEIVRVSGGFCLSC